MALDQTISRRNLLSALGFLPALRLLDAQQQDKPTFSTGLTMDAPEGRERVAYSFGDFNGDGRLDVAYGRDRDTLAVRVGGVEKFLSSDSWVEIKVPSFGMAETCSLNGNAAQDIVMYHPGGPNAKRVDVIVF